MILARVFSNIYQEGGIILIDARGQKYICGNPRKDNPITIKLLKENLNWKLVLDPEIEFPEAYMRNEILIENASLKEFLMDGDIPPCSKVKLRVLNLLFLPAYDSLGCFVGIKYPGFYRYSYSWFILFISKLLFFTYIRLQVVYSALIRT